MEERYKVDPAEAIEAQAFCTRCDGMAEGFRMGLESAKRLYMQQALAKAKKAAPTVEPPKE